MEKQENKNRVRDRSDTHSHRPLIHFDKNGIPVVDRRKKEGVVTDYMKAVAEYKKTFPSREEVQELTPDPAVREMMRSSEGKGDVFERFDSQKPQCSFGLAGVCCKICNMGPCKITEKSPKGICGADEDLIAARNLLRAGAAGTAQHGMHAREVFINLKRAAEGKLDIPIVGKEKLKAIASKFGIKTEGRRTKTIAGELADILLEDLSRPESGEYKTIKAMAPPERLEVWKAMGILPVSAYHEVFEAYHNTGCGTDGDHKNVLKQFLRSGLCFTFTGVVGSNIATDILFGTGDRVLSEVNTGALKEGWVNVAVHGHYPLLVQTMVKLGRSKRFQEKAKSIGAKGIEFYGICCSGLSALYRDSKVLPLSNAVSAELVMGTGALDLWVADVQDVFPSIMEVAACTRTVVVTTSDSARLPGAEHIGFDHHHSNIQDAKIIAEKILDRAIEAHTARKGVPVNIPKHETKAEVGFSPEYVIKHFGSFRPLAEALRTGKILGIVNMVGCNNPKVVYEKGITDVANVLLKNNVLILTNGCASFPLMKLGYCINEAKDKCGSGLSRFIGDDLPPVWHVGECIDNARSSGIFAGVTEEFGKNLYEMPFAFTSPEWSNEKAIDASLGFRLMGINSYHCVEAQIHGSPAVTSFLKEETGDSLGAVMKVDADPVNLGKLIVKDLKKKRKALGLDRKATD